MADRERALPLCWSLVGGAWAGPGRWATCLSWCDDEETLNRTREGLRAGKGAVG